MAHAWWHWTYDVDPYDLDYAPSQVTDYYYEAPAEQKLDPIPDTSFLNYDYQDYGEFGEPIESYT